MARNDSFVSRNEVGRETTGFGSVIGSATPKEDVVAGWEFRNRSSPIDIDGLMPFVQLIGLYNDEEIDKLVGDTAPTRSAVYVDDSGAEVAPDPEEPAATQITQEQRDYFENQIRSNYIYIGLKDYDIPVDDQGTPARMVPGIMLATNYSQAGNKAYEYYAQSGLPKDSGGVGITDLQIETGTKDFMNRRYKLRITVTDPQILNDQPEYAKLSSLQSQFLIIHGWANPQEINGWSGDAPPQLIDVDSEEWPNGRMLVDLRQNNTDGMWGAAVVATTMFDFAFNEVGQLEASFTFMPREISFLATYRVSTFADNINAFLGSGEQNEPVNRDEPEQTPSLFAGFSTGIGAVAGEFGKNLADIINEEQSRYFGDQTGIADLFANADLDFNVSDTLRNLSEKISEWGEMPDSVGRQLDRQRYAESNYRFPFAGPGIRTYKQTSRVVADVAGQVGTEDDPIPTTTVIQHDTKIVYYYLGWILEALRFSMWDLNRNKVRNGQEPFDVKFKYFNIPQNSHYNLAFQDQLEASLPSDINGQVAEALKNLQTNGMPKPRFWDPVYQELNANNVQQNFGDNSVSKSGDNEQPKNVRIAPLTAEQVREIEPMSINVNDHPVYQIMSDGASDEDKEIYKRENWEKLTREEKLLRIPGGEDGNFANADYRRSLVETDDNDPAGPGFVRIMHPYFEGQLLYNFTWVGYIRVDFFGDQRRPNCGLYRTKEFDGDKYAVWIKTNGDFASGGWRGGFLFSKLKNFYFGEYGQNVIVQKNGGTPEGEDDYYRNTTIQMRREGNDPGRNIGIICPAISARYFTPDRYKRAQQSWYNKHYRFLSSYFEHIIRERIIAATEAEGIVNGRASLLSEPIDLFWLTGRKYNNTFHQKVEGQRTGTGAVQPNYNMTVGAIQANGVGDIYDLDDPSVDLSEIVVDETATDLSLLQESLTTDYAQRDATRLQLNGRSGAENDYGYMGARGASVALEQSNLETTSLEELKNKEDAVAAYAKTYNGLLGAIAFWDGRIGQVLKDLYNKDLITVNNTGSSDELTLGGANIVPLQVIAGQIDVRLDDDGFNNFFQFTEKHGATVAIEQGEGAGRNKFTEEDEIGQQFGNLRVSTAASYELKFYKEDEGTIKPVVSPMNLNYQEMIEEGYSRYLHLDFQSAERWQLDHNTVKRIGFSEITENGPGQDYIYMNYVDETLRNGYINGRALYAAQATSQGIDRAVKTAENSYFTYIRKMRELLGNYLSKIQDLRNEANIPQATLQRTLDKIIEAENTQSAILAMNTFLTGESNQRLSPFSKGSALDVETLLPRGGGRVMRLKGTVAQQWAMLLEKRMAYGAGNIENYGPVVGGTPVIIQKHRKVFGWGETRGAEALLTAGSAGSALLAFPGFAKLDNWGGAPKTILNREAIVSQQLYHYEWTDDEGGIHKEEGVMRGTGKRDLDAMYTGNEPPNYLFADVGDELSLWNQPPALNLEVDSTDILHADQLSYIANRHLRVKWLVHAGLIDCDLIRSIAINNFGEEWEGVRIDGEKGYDDAPKQIAGLWPYMMMAKFDPGSGLPTTINTTGTERARIVGTVMAIDANGNLVGLNNRGSATNRQWDIYPVGEHALYDGLLYMVDEDLDFVVQAKDATIRGAWDHLTDSINVTYYESWSGVNPYDWIKMPRRIWGTPTGTQEFSGAESISGPVFCPVPEGPTLAYPGAGQQWSGETWTTRVPGRRVGVPTGNHLPDMSLPTVRQMVHSWSVGSQTIYGVPMFPYSEEKPYGISAANAGAESQTPGFRPGDWSADGQIAFETLEKFKGSVDNVAGDRINDKGGQCINDLLNSLPDEFERGFFSSVKWANRNFEGGEPINEGLAEFLYTEFFNLFTDGRRIGIGQTNSFLNNLKRDFTYRDALFPEGKKEEDISHTIMADFSNQSIQNVAEIPIKRDVLTNLLNRRNSNMSLLQFLRQLLSPSSIGLAGNIQLGVRHTGRNIEIIPASINYKQIETDILAEEVMKQLKADDDESSSTEYLLFDYKTKNSLVESIDMSSKMDPAAFLTYQNSSDLLRGRDYNVLKILSYEGVAEDFKEFLDNTPKADDSGTFYSGIITMGPRDEVRINKSKFTDVPSTVMDAFIAQNPERWAKITSMMQGDNNFTTELLAFYMRGVTLTIHGTTNLQPFNVISVKGVLPDLEGIYIITNLTEKVTPSSFQTIIEGKLLKRRRISEDVFI